jgi:hypothetical protein
MEFYSADIEVLVSEWNTLCIIPITILTIAIDFTVRVQQLKFDVRARNNEQPSPKMLRVKLDDISLALNIRPVQQWRDESFETRSQFLV